MPRHCLWTLIFELTSPANRIVVGYQATTQRLLAIREELTGAYIEQDAVRSIATSDGLQLVHEVAGKAPLDGPFFCRPKSAGRQTLVNQICPRRHSDVDFGRQKSVVAGGLPQAASSSTYSPRYSPICL